MNIPAIERPGWIEHAGRFTDNQIISDNVTTEHSLATSYYLGIYYPH